MRYELDTPERARRVAKRLRAHLAEDGMPIGQTRALDTAAAIFGYRDWQDLSASAGTQERSLDDAVCDPDVVGQRRDHHVAVVAALGIAPVRAAAIVDDLRPTGTRRRSAGDLAYLIADVLAANGAHGFGIMVLADGREEIRLRIDNIFHVRPDAFDRRLIDEALHTFGDVIRRAPNFVPPEPEHPRIKKLYFNRWNKPEYRLLMANAYYWQPGER